MLICMLWTDFIIQVHIKSSQMEDFPTQYDSVNPSFTYAHTPVENFLTQYPNARNSILV